jgi:hypothetical protein
MVAFKSRGVEAGEIDDRGRSREIGGNSDGGSEVVLEVLGHE